MTDGRFGWLVSYPKSGNTWLRMMLTCLLSDGAAIDINALEVQAGIATFGEMDEFLGVEASDLTAAEIADARPALHAALAANSDRPVLLRKVHDRFWRTSSGASAFVPDLSVGGIFLIRDPRDVAVSYSHHRGTEIGATIEYMADDSAVLARIESRGRMQLPQPLGAWSGHALSWLDQAEIPLLVIRYEDMLAEPLRHLALASAHLGITVTDKSLEAAVTATHFEVLSAQEKTHGFRERFQAATAPFFREGRAGGWRERLSAEQIEAIARRHGNVMARFGYL
jgi:aryl sulfotransferase